MNKLALDQMARVLRRMMLRVDGCYRTTSYAAAAVVSGIPPLKLLAEERTSIYHGTTKDEARKHYYINGRLIG